MINPEELYLKSMAQAEEWADQQYAEGMLEDALDTLEGVLIAELKAKGEAVTGLAKLIKKDQRWKEAAEQWRKAKKKALIAKL